MICLCLSPSPVLGMRSCSYSSLLSCNLGLIALLHQWSLSGLVYEDVEATDDNLCTEYQANKVIYTHLKVDVVTTLSCGHGHAQLLAMTRHAHGLDQICVHLAKRSEKMSGAARRRVARQARPRVGGRGI